MDLRDSTLVSQVINKRPIPCRIQRRKTATRRARMGHLLERSFSRVIMSFKIPVFLFSQGYFSGSYFKLASTINAIARSALKLDCLVLQGRYLYVHELNHIEFFAKLLYLFLSQASYIQIRLSEGLIFSLKV